MHTIWSWALRGYWIVCQILSFVTFLVSVKLSSIDMTLERAIDALTLTLWAFFNLLQNSLVMTCKISFWYSNQFPYSFYISQIIYFHLYCSCQLEKIVSFVTKLHSIFLDPLGPMNFMLKRKLLNLFLEVCSSTQRQLFEGSHVSCNWQDSNLLVVVWRSALIWLDEFPLQSFMACLSKWVFLVNW